MKKSKIIYLVILLLSVVQCSLIIRNTNLSEINKDETTETSITEVKNVKYIKEIERDFSNIKYMEVLNYNKINNMWKVKVQVIGSKEEINEAIKQIHDYNIENYNLKYNDKKIFLEMDLAST